MPGIDHSRAKTLDVLCLFPFPPESGLTAFPTALCTTHLPRAWFLSAEVYNEVGFFHLQSRALINKECHQE